MNQRELVRLVANRMGEKKKDINEIVDCLADIICERVIEDDKVTITKLGIFKKKCTTSRIGYDPYNDKKIEIPSTVKLSFESTKYLKNKISQKQ